MRRRSLLAGLAALAGCSGSGGRNDPTATVTPVDVPDGRREGQAEAGATPDVDPLAVGDSRFDAGTPVPPGVQFFHELESGYGVALVPGREAFGPSRTTAPFYLRNRRDEPVFVASGWSLYKYSGHRWVRVPGASPGRSGGRVDPGGVWRQRHRVTNLFDLPVLGPGLYARIQTVRLPDGTIGGEALPVGALFAVEGTNYEMTPVRAARRDGDVARLVTSRNASGRIVFERVAGGDAASAESLVPEVAGAVDLFRDSLPLLTAVPEVRVVTPAAPRAFDLLAEATRRATPVGPGTRLELEGMTFTARVEEP